MEALYSDQYFRGKEYGDYIADKIVLQRNFSNRIKQMQQRLPDLSALSLLEVGCAYGFFLEAAKPYFRQVRGVDLAEGVVEYGRTQLGVEAIAGNFLELDETSFRSDVVCMWDTIEHLRSPDAFTSKAARLIPEGGFLFLTTGDVSSINARWRREKWRLIHPPTHLHYFGKASITALLERQGFDICEISHVGFYRSLGNTFSNLLRRAPSSSRYQWLFKLRFCFYLNLYDIMYVVARKRRVMIV